MDAINEACKSGKIEKVKELLSNDPSLVRHESSRGKLPLHDASRGGHVEIINELLNYSGDAYDPRQEVNRQNKAGWTALHEAAEAGKVEAVQVLLGYNADPCLVNSKGPGTALHLAGNAEVARLLLDAARDPEHEKTKAVEPESPEEGASTTHFLLGRGKSVKGYSAIHAADNLPSAMGSKHLEILLKAKDKDGFTSLEVAIFRLNEEMVEVLLKEWGVADLRDGDQNTGLHLVCGVIAQRLRQVKKRSDRDMYRKWIRLCFEVQVDANSVNVFGKTPLNLVSRNLEASELILEEATRAGFEFTPNDLFVKEVFKSLGEKFLERLKGRPYTAFYLVLLDSINPQSNLGVDVNTKLSKVAKKLDEVTFRICLESKSPLLHLVQAAAAVEKRSAKTPTMAEDFTKLRNQFVKLSEWCMDIDEMDDARYSLSALGSTRSDCFGFLEGGPLGFALKHGQEEMIAMADSQEALDLAWGYERLSNALASPNLEWEAYFSNQDSWSYSMYRQIPFLRAVVTFIFHSILLLMTYHVLYEPVQNTFLYHLRTTLIVMMVAGYVTNEIQQYRSTSYTADKWNYFDMINLTLYIIWAWLDFTGQMDQAKIILTITSCFVLFRLLGFASINKDSGLLVAILIDMMADVMTFLLIFLVVIIGFTIMFNLLFSDVDGFDNLYASGISLFSASLGGFDFSGFTDHENSVLGTVLLIIFLILSMVMLMNMLIALLSDTYNKYQEKHYEKGCVLFSDIVKEFYYNKDSWDWLPAPLCLFNLLLDVLSGFGRFEAIKSAGIWLIDSLVTWYIIKPLCAIFRVLFLLQPNNWTSIFDKKESTWTNTMKHALWYFFCILLTPLVFPFWFFFHYYGWSCAHSFLFFLNPFGKTIDEQVGESEISGTWLKGEDTLQIVFDLNTGHGLGIQCTNMRISKAAESTDDEPQEASGGVEFEGEASFFRISGIPNRPNKFEFQHAEDNRRDMVVVEDSATLTGTLVEGFERAREENSYQGAEVLQILHTHLGKLQVLDKEKSEHWHKPVIKELRHHIEVIEEEEGEGKTARERSGTDPNEKAPDWLQPMQEELKKRMEMLQRKKATEEDELWFGPVLEEMKAQLTLTTTELSVLKQRQDAILTKL